MKGYNCKKEDTSIFYFLCCENLELSHFDLFSASLLDLLIHQTWPSSLTILPSVPAWALISRYFFFLSPSLPLSLDRSNSFPLISRPRKVRFQSRAVNSTSNLDLARKLWVFLFLPLLLYGCCYLFDLLQVLEIGLSKFVALKLFVLLVFEIRRRNWDLAMWIFRFDGLSRRPNRENSSKYSVLDYFELNRK